MKNKCLCLLGVVLTAGFVFAAESAESIIQKLGGKAPTDFTNAAEINVQYVVSSLSIEDRGICFGISRGCDKVWYKSSSKDVLCQKEYYAAAPRGISVTVNQVSRQTDAKGIVVFTPEDLGLQLYPPRKVSVSLAVSGNGITNSVTADFHTLSNPVDAGLYAIALNEAMGLRARQTALLRLKKRHFFTDEQYSSFLGNLYQDEPLPLELPAEVGDLVNGRVEATEDNMASDGWEMTEEEITLTLPGGTELKMRLILAGKFRMGSENGDVNEKPVHEVTISKPYYLGKYEVTQAQWRAVMVNNPSEYQGDSRPVECVSWNDAMDFCRKMNDLCQNSLPPGYRFDLPTEAQWEYACRGGNLSRNYLYSGSNTLDNVAWCDEDEGSTHPVGEKSPNELGIYDMTGNVWEWCRDWYGNYPNESVTDPVGPSSGSRRVHRGGCWINGAGYCRSANRGSSDPSDRGHDLGFRLAVVPVQ